MIYTDYENVSVAELKEQHKEKVLQIAKILEGENISEAFAINRAVHIYLANGNHKVEETAESFFNRSKDMFNKN